jgi:hypothetical protein
MKRGKFVRGQLHLSFGMIFSIILIIVFIAFAVYAILKFLDFQDSVKIGQFGENLQADVDNMWKSSGSYEAKYSLPSKVSSVCFVDKTDANLVFESEDGSLIEEKKIEHLNILEILDGKRSLCFDNLAGKVRMNIKKGFEDDLVTISVPS